MSRLQLPHLRPTTAVIAVGALVLAAQVSASSAAAVSSTLTVSTTFDVSASTGACGNSGITTAPSPLSLREATCLANNRGGSVTITVPAGTYTLTAGELSPGIVPGSNISIVGAGAASTVINGGGSSRVLDLDKNLAGGVSTAISGVTITGGADSTFGGAGIIGGSAYATLPDSLSLTNVVVTGNAANGANLTVTNKPGGGVQFFGGQLTITNSTFSNNTSGSSYGSGVAYGANGAASPEGLTITNSTFSGNSTNNTHGDSTAVGGALSVFGTTNSQFTVSGTRFVNNAATSTNGSGPAVGGAIWQQSGKLSVTGSTFTGNSVSGGTSADAGGAVEVTSGNATLQYNRFVGNTAPSTVGGGGGAVHNGGTTNAADNWWGCNSGPGALGCDTVTGSPTVAPRLQLAATASPATVVGPNGTSTITAALTTDSAGTAISGANLGAFDGLPVTFADPPGDATVTLASGPHTAAFSGGVASIDYHSGATTTGPNPNSATFDNATAPATVTVNQSPAITSANSVNFRVGTAGSFSLTATGYPTPTITESGTLPAGLSFAGAAGSGTATLSGTPTGPGGTFPLTITASNGVNPNATQTFTVTVGQAPAFTSANTATFTAGSAGSFTVTTSGTPAVSTITESGTLPGGLTFTDNGNGTATLSGTPAAGSGGTYPVTLTAANGVTPNATQNLTVQVNQAPAVTTNPNSQTVNPGTSVTFTAAASGVPTPTVQWQRSVNGGASFTNVAGATSTSYTFTAAAGDNGNRYRAVFTNTAGTATTTAATLTVGSAPAFTSTATTTFAVGTAGTFAVTTSGVPNATLSHSGAGFPAWLTLTDNGNGTGTLSGTPPAGSGGLYTFTLTATNGNDPPASQAFTLQVNQSPTITSADHTTFTVGSAGTFTVTTTAGYPTATALTEQGALPGGVTFTDNGDGTATLAGTPTAGTGGAYRITVVAVATGGSTAPAGQPFTLTVAEPPRITSANNATFRVGTAGSLTVTTAAGYPVATTTLSKTGSLPAGVTFTDNGDGTATLAGTPSAGTGGVYPLTIRASNGITPDAAQSFTLTVQQPPRITSADHATLTKGVPGSVTITTAPGQPTATTISRSGTLPGGLTFTDNGDGSATLSGTPTVAGVFAITITASNGVAPNATQSFTLTVNGPPTITSAAQATFAVGTPGTFTVTTSAGTPAATTLAESGALPGGVTFVDNGDGTATLAGTPATGTGGVYPLTITASNGTTPRPTQVFTLTVNEPTTITSSDHATFSRGASSTFTVTTSGGQPSTIALNESGTLPAGVSFTDNGDGTATLAGTPTANGVFPLTFTASNGVQPDATQSFTLTVNAAPSITSADHATFAVATAGTFTVTTAPGTPAATTLTESGALPTGVTFLDNGDGTATLSGTPAAGTGNAYPLTITAANSAANSTQAFTLTVTQLPVITSAAATTFGAGSPGTFTVTTVAGYPAATTLTASGALPGGVSFVDDGDGTATLSGTPAAGSGGSYPLTVTAANSAGHTDQAFTLVVNEAPVITSADHATFTAGAAGSFTVTTGAGFPTPPALTVSGDRLPGGVTFVDNGDGTATLSGTPAAGTGGVYDLVVTAHNGTDPDAAQPFTLTVVQAPAITSAASATFTVGTAGSATVSTSGYPTPSISESGALPSGVTFTDNGDGTATIAGTPSVAGDAPIVITAANGTAPDATQAFTLHVVKATQTITVTSMPPSPALVGGSYTPVATSDSGLPVAVTVDGSTTNSACTFDGTHVVLAHAGTCVVDFDQAGDGTFAAAPRVQQTFTVTTNATTVVVTTSASPTVYGQAAHATAAVSTGSAGSAAPAGTVQFAVDGVDLGAPVAVTGGTADSDTLTGPSGASLAPGSHVVTATFVPADPVTYAGSTNTVTQIVDQAATTTSLSVQRTTITAAVVAVAPGSGTPTGPVTFTVGGRTVGTASLDGGVATLTYTVPAGMTQQVGATYAGDTDFTMSSASTSRTDPTITATVSSATARTKYGWYRSPVTVTFHCTTHGAALTAPCPAAVVLAASGAARSVSRTITATDGGTATVVVRVNIDRYPPTVKVTGVRNGSTYAGSVPKIGCVGSDGLSGLASCTVSTRTSGLTVSYRATATDKAGNTASVSGRVTVLRIALTGARLVDGAYDVAVGHTYTLVAYADTRPVYYDAAVYPLKPTKRDNAFHAAGRGRWTLGVTMQTTLRTHRYWNLGVKIGKTLYTVKIRV